MFAIEKKNGLALPLDGVLLLGVFFCGFLASQRFLMQDFYAYVCVVPVLISSILAAFARHKADASLTLILLSIFYLVDSGGAIYAETPSWIRYYIYTLAICCLFFFSRVNVTFDRLFLVSTFVLLLLLNSLSVHITETPRLSLNIATRDILVSMLFVWLCVSTTKLKCDERILLYGLIGFLLGELYNLAFQYNSNEHYLSFNTTKVFLVFGPLIALRFGVHLVGGVTLCLAVAFVFLFMGSRMIPISALGFIALIMLQILVAKTSYLKAFAVLVGLLLTLAVVSLVSKNIEMYSGFKALDFLIQIIREKPSLELLKLADPTRYQEHILFLEQHPLRLLFGSGIGAGIYDINGHLNSVSFTSTSFSDEELRSKVFFNFHDAWVEYGVRFGLVWVLFVVGKLVLQPLIHGQFFKMFGAGMLLVNSTYSTAGILLTFLVLTFLLRDELATKSEK